MNKHVAHSLRSARSVPDELIADETAHAAIASAGGLLIEAFERKGKVFSCDNGGSMFDAMHFAEYLTGRYRGDRAALAAVAISDAGHLRCIANDFG